MPWRILCLFLNNTGMRVFCWIPIFFFHSNLWSVRSMQIHWDLKMHDGGKGIHGGIQCVLLLLIWSDVVNLNLQIIVWLSYKELFSSRKNQCCLIPAYRLICSAPGGFAPSSNWGLTVLHALGIFSEFFLIFFRFSLSYLISRCTPENQNSWHNGHHVCHQAVNFRISN